MFYSTIWVFFFIKFCIAFAVLYAAFGTALKAADPSPLSPVAFVTAPPCSKRPGVRAIRSDLIQFGPVTASLSAQATRDTQSCFQTAALWVTRKDVSQQYELRDAAVNTFAIHDIAPDSASILLSSARNAPASEARHPTQMAILSLSDGTLKWTPIADILNFKNCEASFEPQEFLDATHILIAVRPLASSHKYPNCTTQTQYFAYNITNRAVKQLPTPVIRRFAQSIGGPVHSCKSDPDVMGACYSSRARLAVGDDGNGMIVWTMGSTHLMSVQEDRVPATLTSMISPTMRIYATMVICPLLMDHPSTRREVCVDAATGFHPDPLPRKGTRSAASQKALPTVGHSR